MSDSKNFKGLRGIFFPIHAYELKKVLPMGIMLFFILFNYYSLKNIKDSLIVTSVGAEAISFLKLFFVPPAAILFMLAYTKLCDVFKNEHLFYITLSLMLIFFTLFLFVFYPYRGFFHPSAETISSWQKAFPAFHWMIALFGVWTYTLFFIFAELWSSAVLSLLFWQFANQITHVAEAKRIYGVLAFVGQSSVVLTGIVGAKLSKAPDLVPDGVDPWQLALTKLISIVIFGGIIIMLIYRWIYKNVLTDKRLYDKPYLPGVDPNKKKKGSLLDSLKAVFTSPYLGLVAMLVIGYGFCINLIECLWKDQARSVYCTKNAYNVFMNEYTVIIGLISLVGLLIGNNILRLCSWFVAAITTPLIFLIGGLAFFVTVIFKAELAQWIPQLADNQAKFIIWLGVVILAVIKSAKFSVFDLSKEMTFIPLDEEMKVKGKAAVDVLGNRFGKSGGAFSQVFLLMVIGGALGGQATYFTIAPYTFSIFLAICFLWIFAVKRLNKKVKEANIKAGEISND